MKKIIIVFFVSILCVTNLFGRENEDYLNFTAINGPATIALKKEGKIGGMYLQYSTDNCVTWIKYEIGEKICLPDGGRVFFKALPSDSVVLQSYHHRQKRHRRLKPCWHIMWKKPSHYKFVMRGIVSADGNIMSLIDETMKENEVPDNAFCRLFEGCHSLIHAPQLPATKLGEECYEGMFAWCSSLTEAPELPATELAKECYEFMFLGCKALKKASELPATELEDYCYARMFVNCISLAEAPSLNAMKLADGCYEEMFQECTSLVKIPSLPADSLKDLCYARMFAGCILLTEAPSLPAMKLADGCYEEMFRKCTSLTRIPLLPAYALEERCYNGMFDGCSSLSINCEKPGEAWKIPQRAIGTSAWNENMFKNTRGCFKGDPEIGKEYYVLF